MVTKTNRDQRERTLLKSTCLCMLSGERLSRVFRVFSRIAKTRQMRRLSQSLVVFFSETAGKMPRDDRWPSPLPCFPIQPHHSFQTRVRTQRLCAYSSSYGSRRLTSSRICSSKRSKVSSGAPCMGFLTHGRFPVFGRCLTSWHTKNELTLFEDR